MLALIPPRISESATVEEAQTGLHTRSRSGTQIRTSSHSRCNIPLPSHNRIKVILGLRQILVDRSLSAHDVALLRWTSFLERSSRGLEDSTS